MSELALVYVNPDSPRSAAESAEIPLKGSVRGEACVLDFFMAMAMEGRAFQVMAGTDYVPETGDQPVATTAAEMCVDAASGLTVIPVFFSAALITQDGSDQSVLISSHPVVSSAGTVFIPLPLLTGSTVASRATARMDDQGGVTVTAGSATLTRRHFNWGVSVADIAQAGVLWDPKMPPICAGAICVYVQIGATTTGPDYIANLDYIELPTVNIS